MYLVIDVGNTNIVSGVFSAKKGDYKLISTFRMSTVHTMTTDEFAGRAAIRYEEWCDAFEAVWAKPKKEKKEDKKGLKKVDEDTPQAVKDLIKEKEKK